MSFVDPPLIVAVLDHLIDNFEVSRLLQHNIRWVEWRFDLIHCRFEDALVRISNFKKQGLNVIGTWRENSENFYDRLPFFDQFSSQVDYVDIEQDSFFFKDLARKLSQKTPLIASFHDYYGVLSEEEFLFRFREADSVGALFKCVVTPQSYHDFYQFLCYSDKLMRLNKKFVLMCMGEYAGEISRLISMRMSSSFFVYGCVDNQPVVPGQISVFDLQSCR